MLLKNRNKCKLLIMDLYIFSTIFKSTERLYEYLLVPYIISGVFKNQAEYRGNVFIRSSDTTCISNINLRMAAGFPYCNRRLLDLSVFPKEGKIITLF